MIWDSSLYVTSRKNTSRREQCRQELSVENKIIPEGYAADMFLWQTEFIYRIFGWPRLAKCNDWFLGFNNRQIIANLATFMLFLTSPLCFNQQPTDTIRLFHYMFYDDSQGTSAEWSPYSPRGLREGLENYGIQSDSAHSIPDDADVFVSCHA